jgi:hypothetical protein
MIKALVQACEQTAATTSKVLAWLADPKNELRVGAERPSLERKFRSLAYQARRLAHSVERPMCVGVFGPSQAGKSYLVSVLARKGDALTAIFDDPAQREVDFINKINPYGEKEATGLVTRFSRQAPNTPKGFPVALRLLSQTDIVKILANSYFLDADQQLEATVPIDVIAGHMAEFEGRQRAEYVDQLREEDVWDVQEYFLKQLRRTEAQVFNPFWDRIANCAPRLALADRAGLFSILWGRHEPLTNLFLKLLESLNALGFAEDAFCRLDALVPADKGILNVETLEGLGQPGAPTLTVAVSSGRSIELPRPIVTALAAELRIVLKEIPWPFLQHTDLLDFPGYRTRMQHNLGRFLAEAGGKALKELFLRGKVDYLFQRYTIDQELTGMLLCIPPSNLEVATLPGVIDEWIALTHGRTPDDRRGRPTLLFFLLTKFDQHFAEKVIDEQQGADLKIRFEARMQASLLAPFAKLPGSWPLRWNPNKPFKNCFWIRNPQYKAEAVIEYDGPREVRILPQKVDRIAALRAACVQVGDVRAHFRDPEMAFDEAMRLNDGGASYLAENLAKVCGADVKTEQVRGRLQDLRSTLRAALAPYYVSSDAAQRVEERTTAAERVLDDFDGCVADAKFGSFLRGLYVDRGALADALHAMRSRPARPPDATPVPERPRGGLRADVMRIRGGAEGGKSKAASPAASRPAVVKSPVLGSARNEDLVRAAMQVWAQTLRDAADSREFSDSVALSADTVREIVAEVSTTARRLGLEDQVRKSLAAVSHTEGVEQAFAKATIVCERMINRFVSDLGFDARRPEPTFDAKGLTLSNGASGRDFAVRWLGALHEQFIANAQSADGLIADVEQNTRLGAVISELDAAIPA